MEEKLSFILFMVHLDGLFYPDWAFWVFFDCGRNSENILRMHYTLFVFHYSLSHYISLRFSDLHCILLHHISLHYIPH